MSTARLTIGALFSTINETASALTNTVGTLNAGITMASNYVAVLAKEQDMDNMVRVATYQEKLIERASMEEAERQLAILKFTDKSQKHQDLYAAAQDRFTKLFQPKEA